MTKVQVKQLNLNCWYPVSDNRIRKPPAYTNENQGHPNVLTRPIILHFLLLLMYFSFKFV